MNSESVRSSNIIEKYRLLCSTKNLKDFLRLESVAKFSLNVMSYLEGLMDRELSEPCCSFDADTGALQCVQRRGLD